MIHLTVLTRLEQNIISQCSSHLLTPKLEQLQKRRYLHSIRNSKIIFRSKKK